MHPAGARRRVIDHLGELQGDEGVRLARRVGLGLARPGLGRPLAGDRARGHPLSGAVGDLGQAAPRRHRGVDLHQGVAFAVDGIGVPLLEQQPVGPLGRLAAIALEPDQSPAALEPLALQIELDHALREGGVQVLVLRRPGSRVPQLDRPCPVVAGRDGPFEIAVVQRVVFDLDRQPLDGRVARRGLGDGPGLQHAVMFDAEVVMQAGRGMALDQIAQPARAGPLAPGAGLAPLRLRRGAEVSLGLIGVEFAARRHDGSTQQAGEGCARRRWRRPGAFAPVMERRRR
ncbi:hypothetical protein D3C80_705270 [compost metagenome]